MLAIREDQKGYPFRQKFHFCLRHLSPRQRSTESAPWSTFHFIADSHERQVCVKANK